jgi:hypothetical protein
MLKKENNRKVREWEITEKYESSYIDRRVKSQTESRSSPFLKTWAMWVNKPNERASECKKALLLVLEAYESPTKIDRWGLDIRETDWKLLQKNPSIEIIGRSAKTTRDASSGNTTMCWAQFAIT